jgi:hypothetical protein
MPVKAFNCNRHGFLLYVWKKADQDNALLFFALFLDPLK